MKNAQKEPQYDPGRNKGEEGPAEDTGSPMFVYRVGSGQAKSSYRDVNCTGARFAVRT